MHLNLRQPCLEDCEEFLRQVHQSQTLHYPWVSPPNNPEEYQDYLTKTQQENQKSYFLCQEEQLVGVFNLSELVRGCFQCAYLGFYAFATFSGKGYMSLGLNALLEKAFNEHGLHRIEANIQPQNRPSINLVTANHFKKEGFSPRYLKINGVWCDHERWALTYEDWVHNEKN